MIAKSLEEVFFFGTAVRYLQDASAGKRVHDSPDKEWFILSNLKVFFQLIENIGLHVTNRAAYKLRKLMQELENTPKEAVLTPAQAKQLSDGMGDVRKTLQAEIEVFESYLVTPKRLDVNKLLKYPEQLLAPQVFNRLPALARFDISEAGKCIAFERPTAAAFHLLRATECALRTMCEKCVKREKPQLMWGTMVARLRGVRSLRGEQSLFNNLDDIRLTFRNPTQHPEKVYDIEEVQDLWGRCADALNRISKHL